MAGSPTREIRALFDDEAVTVYQAYSSTIADAALAAGRFVPPFKVGRMTWIKPSFLWMMYRSGWATKPDQERVLAITITRAGFEWALAHSSLSHHDPAVYASHSDWSEIKSTAPVRIQWDPERSLRLEPLDHRAIQIGLGGAAADRYVNDWIVAIADATSLARQIHDLVRYGDLDTASVLLPNETRYPLDTQLAARIGATC